MRSKYDPLCTWLVSWDIERHVMFEHHFGLIFGLDMGSLRVTQAILIEQGLIMLKDHKPSSNGQDLPLPELDQVPLATNKTYQERDLQMI